MCAVSVVSEHYGTYGDPGYYKHRQIVWPPALPPSLPWTPDALADLKEILKRLDVLDKKLGLEHCEDPKKAEWMKAIEERLAALENK